jgi:hypothetical protein
MYLVKMTLQGFDNDYFSTLRLNHIQKYFLQCLNTPLHYQKYRGSVLTPPSI